MSAVDVAPFPCIGVIGGMGPDAAILFMHLIAVKTVAACDQDHIDIDLLQHCSVPDRTDYILDHEKPNPAPLLIADARALAGRGATHIAIPCNTAHYFYDELQAAVDIPVLNMIELAADQVAAVCAPGDRIGVLGTRGTIGSGLYQHALEARGLVAVNPTESVQVRVDQVIFERVKANLPVEPAAYREILAQMVAAGCALSLIGCTELSVPEHAIAHDFRTVDALDTLAIATVEAAGKQVRV